MTATEQEIRNSAGMSGDVRAAAVNTQQSLIVGDEVRQWIKEGRVFSAIDGVLTTPATFTAVDLVRQTPNMMIRVPAGIVVVPLMVLVTPEATGAAVFQMLISSCNNDPGTSNMVAATVAGGTAVNVNTRFAGVSPQALPYITGTGATGTAPTGVSDLFREYQQVDHDAITGAPTPPRIYNPRRGWGQEAAIGSASAIHAFLAYYCNGTSSTGFGIMTWAEFTYDEYYG